MAHLREVGPDARIVGLGNTMEDIVAYRAAGIESALALWDVPDDFKEHARNAWGADRTFGSVAQFTQRCREGGIERVVNPEGSSLPIS